MGTRYTLQIILMQGLKAFCTVLCILLKENAD